MTLTATRLRRLAAASALLTATIAASCRAPDGDKETIRISVADDAGSYDGADGSADAIVDAAMCPGPACSEPCPTGGETIQDDTVTPSPPRTK